ncbi:MAG: NADH-quinone oxidoreductase subunit C, partial [Desulfurococcaceae archaeon]
MDKKLEALNKYTLLARSYGGSILVEDNTVYINAPREHLVDLASKLFNDFTCSFRTCIGIDERPLNGHFSVTHVFTDDRNSLYVLLKTYAEAEAPRIPSITNVVPAADWCEME